MQSWQKMPKRNSGRLLLFPGGLSQFINRHRGLHPIECRGNTTNEGRPLQHSCDFHGKLIISDQILWHGTREQRQKPNVYPCKSFKTPKKLRGKFRTEFLTQKFSPI